MAIIKGGQAKKDKAPIVASEDDTYGLYVGPKGAFAKAGIQCKAPKWEYLFSKDESGTPNLLNILDYLFDKSSDFVAVERGVEDFINAYAERKAKEEAKEEKPAA